MTNKKCIQIVENHINKNGKDETLEKLLQGIEKENILFLDLIPTDLIKDLMPESTDLKWIRSSDWNWKNGNSFWV